MNLGKARLPFVLYSGVRCGAHTFAAGTLLFLAPNMRAPARDSSGADCDLRLRPPGKVCMTQAQISRTGTLCTEFEGCLSEVST